jgi:hypothetical protein
MTRAYNTATTQQNTGGAVPAFLAGKNKIINGDFGIWQRGASFTLTTNVTTYTADRFMVLSTHSSGSTTVTQQTFTPGTAPVAGYEGQYYFRITNSAATTNTAPTLFFCGYSLGRLNRAFKFAKRFCGVMISSSVGTASPSSSFISLIKREGSQCTDSPARLRFLHQVICRLRWDSVK